MDFISCSSNNPPDKLSVFSSESILGQEEIERTDEVCVGDLLSTNKQEPFYVSHGEQIMEKKYQQEKQQLEEKIADLTAQCNAKKKEIASLQEILSAKDEEIVHLNETVASLQQNGGDKEIDFSKQLKTIDEQLRKTTDTISQAKEHCLKKKAEVDNLCTEPELFDAEKYFGSHTSPSSWFDNLQNNKGCLEINMYPVRAKDLESFWKKNDSHDKPFEPANPKISQAPKDNEGTSQPAIPLPPDTAAGLPPNIPPVQQNSNPFRKFVKEKRQQAAPLPAVFIPAVNSAASPPPINLPANKNCNPFRKVVKEKSQSAAPLPSMFVPAVNSADAPLKDSLPAQPKNSNPFRRVVKEKRQQAAPLPAIFIPAVSSAASPPPKLDLPANKNCNPFRKVVKEKSQSAAPLPFIFVPAVNRADAPPKDSLPAQPKNSNPFRRVVKEKCQQAGRLPAIFVPAVNSPTSPPRNIPPAQRNSNPFRKVVKGKPNQPAIPPPPIFGPVNSAAVAYQAKQNSATERAKTTDQNVDKPTVNPFSKAAKANGYVHHRPLPFFPASTVLDGSLTNMPNAYPADAFTHTKVNPFPHIEQQGFLSRTIGKWLGF